MKSAAPAFNKRAQRKRLRRSAGPGVSISYQFLRHTLRQLTPRDKNDIDEFRQASGVSMVGLDRYLSGEWEWHELWDYNFDLVVPSSTICSCKIEGLRASGRRKGYPRSIRDLEHLGFKFNLIRGGGSWYVDAYYQCSCGQKWKEEFVEAMQYNGNHAYAISDEEFNT